MRFDPQSNYVPRDQHTVASSAGAGGGGLRTVGTLLIVLLLLGGAGAGVWYFARGEILPAVARAEPPPPEVSKPPAVIEPEPLVDEEPVIEDDPRTLDEAIAEIDFDAMLDEPDEPDEPDHRELSREQCRIAKSLAAIGRHREAMHHYVEAIRLDSENANAHYRLGLAFVRIGDVRRARREHERLKELDPSLANLLGNLLR